MKAISLLILLAACASPKEDLAKVAEVPLIGKHPGIRECYFDSPNYLKNPGAEVGMKVEFEVNQDGTTKDHKVLSSTLPDEKFKKCIVDSLRSLQYPPQKEAFIVEQSFTLSPGKK